MINWMQSVKAETHGNSMDPFRVHGWSQECQNVVGWTRVGFNPSWPKGCPWLENYPGVPLHLTTHAYLQTFKLTNIPMDKLEFQVTLTGIFFGLTEREPQISHPLWKKCSAKKGKGITLDKGAAMVPLSAHIEMVTGFILTPGPLCVEFACSPFVGLPAFSIGTQVPSHKGNNTRH